MAKQSWPRAMSAQVIRLLREEREKQGISMNRLAEMAGLSQPMISLVERGLRNPTIDTLLRMSAALEINLDAVLRQARLAAAKQSPK